MYSACFPAADQAPAPQAVQELEEAREDRLPRLRRFALRWLRAAAVRFNGSSRSRFSCGRCAVTFFEVRQRSARRICPSISVCTHCRTFTREGVIRNPSRKFSGKKIGSRYTGVCVARTASQIRNPFLGLYFCFRLRCVTLLGMLSP